MAITTDGGASCAWPPDPADRGQGEAAADSDQPDHALPGSARGPVRRKLTAEAALYERAQGASQLGRPRLRRDEKVIRKLDRRLHTAHTAIEMVYGTGFVSPRVR